MKQKKIPLRKCIACGESKEKKELLRIVKNKEDEIFVDLTGKKNGRGAYVCKNKDCFETMLKSKKFEKTFHRKIDEELKEEIEEVINGK